MSFYTYENKRRFFEGSLKNSHLNFALIANNIFIFLNLKYYNKKYIFEEKQKYFRCNNTMRSMSQIFFPLKLL